MATLERSIAEEATSADVKAARDRALKSLGMTYPQLAKKARRGALRTRRERVVWLTYRDLDEG